MTKILETITNVQRINDNTSSISTEDLDLEGNEEANVDIDLDINQDEISGDSDKQTNQNLDTVSAAAAENPDRQGLIRKVKGAHLVYKRETETGSFEELWIYNLGTLKDELEIRKAIIAGTDIPVNNHRSPDGTQEYSMWSAGNAEMILITGLPN